MWLLVQVCTISVMYHVRSIYYGSMSYTPFLATQSLVPVEQMIYLSGVIEITY